MNNSNFKFRWVYKALMIILLIFAARIGLAAIGVLVVCCTHPAFNNFMYYLSFLGSILIIAIDVLLIYAMCHYIFSGTRLVKIFKMKSKK